MADRAEFLMLNKKKIRFHNKFDCNLCNKKNLVTLWKLPKYPLTEQFGIFEKKFPSFNQALQNCSNCGHVQLKTIIDQKVLYSSKFYNYKSQINDKSKNLSNLFIKFFKENVKKQPNQILDVGGNDGYIVKNIFPKSKKIIIDPIAKKTKNKKIVYVNKFLNEIDIQKNFGLIDCIICRHTLEHIPNPIKFINQLLQQTNKNSKYFFEVPSYKHMILKKRFDTIIHQHINYFDRNSIERIMSAVNCNLVKLKYLDNGPCGGSILFYFQRNKAKYRINKNKIYKKRKYFLKKKFEYIKDCKKIYNKVSRISNLYGYGAGLMAATYFYFLNIPTKKILYILDDDVHKNNKSYKNINIKIKFPRNLKKFISKNFIITSLENYNAIRNKILKTLPSFNILN